MATIKKSVSADTVREEMRLLNEVANDAVDTSSLLNWLTPEFWTMAGTAVTNIVAVLVLIGWIKNTDAATLTQALSAIVGATEVIVVNSILIWKFVAGRNELRARMVEAQYQYMTMVTVEKMRAN